ncbi:hypothetical protein Q31b_22900 [Novipirellula aureliae]|uniref:DUF2062 domain-containing protein n=1 Tax=Novipirellula aureliae TaxID=2527966 RepID=A0A5C6E2U7_9BACT|nr:TIGR03546 family protein [Novipirellula aureliae]TWU43252.1 hypothetical protein Q31b_22900 [Novipirellula aureliae]
MIIWSIKLFSNVRKAIAGRQHPHQLAWAVALGALLGVVPHGNLVAVFLLIFLLSVRVNHAMAGLVTIGVSFIATRLDPSSHEVGQYVLTHPLIAPKISAAWELPLAPWTQLNNTVVMGSFIIGLAALLPIFVLTYPVFRLLANRARRKAEFLEANIDTVDEVPVKTAGKSVILDSGHAQPSPPHSKKTSTQSSPKSSDFQPLDSTVAKKTAVETRIDVIRVRQNAETTSTASNDHTSASTSGAGKTDQQPMDEALNYLLRQLRTSQKKDAA